MSISKLSRVDFNDCGPPLQPKVHFANGGDHPKMLFANPSGNVFGSARSGLEVPGPSLLSDLASNGRAPLELAAT
jgi:hypothetical protein